MEGEKVTAEGTFTYYDEVPALVIEGKNFIKTFFDDEARDLFKILIGKGWTKCSDNHLPDMDVDVLGTSKDGDVLKVTRMKSYFEDAGWEWVLTDDIEGAYYHPDEIIAWMPLPKRYIPQEEKE